MTFQICFNNQIHKITNQPADYNTLLQKISEIFGAQLPQDWALQYLDSDEDKIMLANQEDYENFLEEQVANSKKPVKIFVLTKEDIQNNPTDFSSQDESFEEILEKGSQSTSSSQYIEGPQDRVEIEEEIIEKPQPEPFDERLGGLIQDRFATPVQEEKSQLPSQKRVVIEKSAQAKPSQEKPKPQQQQKKAQAQAQAGENKPKAAPQTERQQPQARKTQAPRDIFSDLFGGFGEQATPSPRGYAPQERVQPKAQPQTTRAQTQRQQQQRPQRQQEQVHSDVECNGCGKFPLTGIRYKCYECPNFDFCERCEQTRWHPHEFMQIPKPQPERNEQQYYTQRTPTYRRAQPQYPQYREYPSDPFGFSSYSPRMSESYRPRTSQYTPRRSDFGFFPMFL